MFFAPSYTIQTGVFKTVFQTLKLSFHMIQIKAQRFFLGTGKYTPSDAFAGDMGWVPTFIKQYKSICNQWTRYASMPGGRVNKRIFNFCKSKSGARCQNWHFRVSKHLSARSMYGD